MVLTRTPVSTKLASSLEIAIGDASHSEKANSACGRNRK
ncbi:hypothetical protein BDIM_15890 [Brevundimonas diminuta ATCC 11568]|nr:hypothetical protein BDIM_15890 [Brevundimonas diminuta ATCC 11568]